MVNTYFLPNYDKVLVIQLYWLLNRKKKVKVNSIRSKLSKIRIRDVLEDRFRLFLEGQLRIQVIAIRIRSPAFEFEVSFEYILSTSWWFLIIEMPHFCALNILYVCPRMHLYSESLHRNGHMDKSHWTYSLIHEAPYLFTEPKIHEFLLREIVRFMRNVKLRFGSVESKLKPSHFFDSLNESIIYCCKKKIIQTRWHMNGVPFWNVLNLHIRGVYKGRVSGFPPPSTKLKECTKFMSKCSLCSKLCKFFFSV